MPFHILCTPHYSLTYCVRTVSETFTWKALGFPNFSPTFDIHLDQTHLLVFIDRRPSAVYHHNSD